MMAKHSALNRASGVRVPAGPREIPGSASGRPLRSERRNPGSSPGPGTAPIGDRLMAGRQALTLLVEVRILVPEQLCCATNALSENRIDDDARGRAPPRPQRCPRSRSGDGAWLKSRRCWFDSRRGHSIRVELGSSDRRAPVSGTSGRWGRSSHPDQRRCSSTGEHAHDKRETRVRLPRLYSNVVAVV